MASLAEIRAKLQDAQNKGSGSSQQSGGDNAIYPHWNMQEGKEAVIRLLPDGDTNNTFFWVERAMINLEFADSLSTSIWKKWVENSGRSVHTFSKAL